jgi:hypothetical protein
MTENDSFAPECWFLAEEGDAELAGVCLTWKEGLIKVSPSQPVRAGEGSARPSYATRSRACTSAVCSASASRSTRATRRARCNCTAASA